MVTLQDLVIATTQRLTSAGIPADEARTEARLLLQHAFGLTREQLILRSDSPIDGGQGAILEPLLVRRANREPLPYILGERGFYGLSFRVTPAVLIPRPETELLVEAALNPLREAGEGRRLSGGERQGEERHILDIGTGSGCIAITLAKLLPGTLVWATDISEEALDVAKENASRHGATVEFCLGDLLAPLPPDLCFSVIVSNPPYIAPADAETLEPEVGVFEPHLALFDPISGSDGLTLYRRLASEAPARLTNGGWLMVEVGQGQAEAVAQLFADAGLTAIEVREDLAGIPRVVLAQKSGLDRT
ncbi:peptide chain release factor N(5)-glutamine methyltransferase [Armatimonas sp.]|uniref:peptide chain release factor N(5)-glutamine methyltransferase n=1 Tax=Armatimonas sp. TaxID=1872638 RepID=UPI00286D37BB|nr:peptide chain release factor N(5)-glutamine methyltransferase [Armatimonas sp.]